MHNKAENLKKLIKKADHVLATAERNKFGEWIGNEHLLLEWINEIKQFIKNYLDRNDELYTKLTELISLPIGTPNDVKEVRKVLEEICLNSIK